jgi:hypothetical protein
LRRELKGVTRDVQNMCTNVQVYIACTFVSFVHMYMYVCFFCTYVHVRLFLLYICTCTFVSFVHMYMCNCTLGLTMLCICVKYEMYSPD